jgi:hypothetical protein
MFCLKNPLLGEIQTAVWESFISIFLKIEGYEL